MGRHTLGREARQKGSHTSEQIKKGIELYHLGTSIRKAAQEVQVAYPTLRRYIIKHQNDSNAKLVPHYEVNKVFNEEQEASLKEYIVECADKFYGLTSKECRRVAYQMAKINNIKTPQSWHKEGIAGKDWLRGFRNRHTDLTIKKPEACSLARATSFNKENVQAFFAKLKEVMCRHPSFGNGSRLYNLDETSTTTVQRPQKVLAPKGRSSCKITSGERGVLVTTCCIINAIGQSLPPVMVFPRKIFKQHMLNGAPPGTLGLATPTGWMNGELFVQVMQHFIKFTCASKENPALLILDNHESHLSIEALDLAKSCGVTVLTLHPHTTAKMQPLDVGLLAPFKSYYNSAVDSWLMRHPGHTYSIYDIAECVGIAYMKSMTPINIMNAFKKCGIFPLDENIFTEIDFLPSEVTNRPAPDELEITDDEKVNRIDCGSPSILIFSTVDDNNRNTTQQVTPVIKDIQTQLSNIEECEPSTSAVNNSSVSVVQQSPIKFISPKVFRPSLKAGPRKGNRQRRRGKSMVATDTPEKTALAEIKQKKNIKIPKTVKTDLFKLNKRPKVDTESSEEEQIDFQGSGSSSGAENFGSESEDDQIILDDKFLPLERNPRPGDYVIIVLQSKKSNVYYVAKILERLNDEDCDYFVSYLKLKSKWNQKFSEPLEPDTAGVNLKDIKYILPSPKIEGSNRRQATFKFSVDMSLLNLRY